MAEFAAHLNQGTTNANPTIFEIVAEESMASVLRPAVSYAFKVLASSNPDRWGWIWRLGDELYLCFDYIAQNHYLKNFGGSFSEHFYGLKRVSSVGKGKNGEGLSSFQKYLSLVMLVVVPYAKLKLDELFERTREETFKWEFISLLFKKTPLLSAAEESICLCVPLSAFHMGNCFLVLSFAVHIQVFWSALSLVTRYWTVTSETHKTRDAYTQCARKSYWFI